MTVWKASLFILPVDLSVIFGGTQIYGEGSIRGGCEPAVTQRGRDSGYLGDEYQKKVMGCERNKMVLY